MGKHFVLVHGAWHGGWVWDGLLEALRESGHTGQALTLPGHAPGDKRAGITMADYVGAVEAALKSQARPVVLVAHSSAGFLLQQAAPRVPDKIEQLIFLNAFILPEGKAQFDLVPPDASTGMTAAANASPDLSVPVLEDFVRNALAQDVSRQDQDRLLARLAPQPLALFTTPVSAPGFASLGTKKTFLFCKDDASLPPGGFQGMAQLLGQHQFMDMPGGHETLFFNPRAVAAKFVEIAGS
jgi:alpha-beta hydrolase superfamily lysophospholipase